MLDLLFSILRTAEASVNHSRRVLAATEAQPTTC
jgi:hypothetical protein